MNRRGVRPSRYDKSIYVSPLRKNHFETASSLFQLFRVRVNQQHRRKFMPSFRIDLIPIADRQDRRKERIELRQPFGQIQFERIGREVSVRDAQDNVVRVTVQDGLVVDEECQPVRRVSPIPELDLSPDFSVYRGHARRHVGFAAPVVH